MRSLEMLDQITSFTNENNIENIIQNNIVKPHLENKAMLRFHEYYFKILQNEEYFLQTENFFQEFTKRYGIKDPKKNYIEIEKDKERILSEIKSLDSKDIYLEAVGGEYYSFRYRYLFTYSARMEKECNNFFKALYFIYNFRYIYGYSTLIEKEYDVFFTKILHTFRPKDFPILDYNIKHYFNLDSDNFITAFTVVSNTYRLWAEKNQDIIQRFREAIVKHDTKKVFPKDKITDLKILDMIFWVEAKKKYNY